MRGYIILHPNLYLTIFSIHLKLFNINSIIKLVKIYNYIMRFKMKKLYRPLIILLSSVLIIALAISIYYSRVLDEAVLKSENSVTLNKVPKYHFAAIVHKSDEPYWNGILKGINQSAEINQTVIEINYTEGEDEYNDTLKYLDMAIISNVDGIITMGYDTPEFSNLIDKAFQRGIPVVTIDSDDPSSKRISFVTTNDFELGSKAGKQISQAFKGTANVAIILENPEKKKNDNSSILISGFKDAVENNNNIKIKCVKTSASGILGAKDVLQDILNNYKEVNSIICTSSNDTIGIAEQLVYYNKVGDFTVIGYDDSDEILKYVQKGVVYSTLIPDPIKIGMKSVESLINEKERGSSTSDIYTDINVVNKDNVNLYIKKMTEERSKLNK